MYIYETSHTSWFNFAESDFIFKQAPIMPWVMLPALVDVFTGSYSLILLPWMTSLFLLFSRDPITGRIIRACDAEATLADEYVYEQCENVTGYTLFTFVFRLNEFFNRS